MFASKKSFAVSQLAASSAASPKEKPAMRTLHAVPGFVVVRWDGLLRMTLLLVVTTIGAKAQQADLPLSHLNAGQHDPIYTTYAAPLARSEYFYDQAYFLEYADPAVGIEYQNQTGGSFG